MRSITSRTHTNLWCRAWLVCAYELMRGRHHVAVVLCVNMLCDKFVTFMFVTRVAQHLIIIDVVHQMRVRAARQNMIPVSAPSGTGCGDRSNPGQTHPCRATQASITARGDLTVAPVETPRGGADPPGTVPPASRPDAGCAADQAGPARHGSPSRTDSTDPGLARHVREDRRKTGWG